MPPDQTNIDARGPLRCCCCCTASSSTEVLSTHLPALASPLSPRTVRRIVIAVGNLKLETLCTIEILQRFHKLWEKSQKKEKAEKANRADRKKRGLSTSASIEAKEMDTNREGERESEREGGKFVSNETADGFYIRKFSTTTTTTIRRGRRWRWRRRRSREHRQKKRL